MEDLSGKQLGRYQVLSALGQGGMAAVYKAYQPGMERYVALKILPRHLAGDPEFQGRFEQEAKVIAKLQHVHILPVHDFGEDDGYTYIVMPFVQTGTLADLMQGEPLPLPQVRRVISQVGEALAYAHDRDLIHRDVKPSNILIDDVGNCLLTDFGIAKIVGGTMKFTQTGAIIGTPAYMSPEQIKGEDLDGRSDLYSLGVVLFELVTGRPPYNAETPPAIFVKHLHDPLPLPRSIKPDLPEALELVILKCLAKNPDDRYATVGEMLRAMRSTISPGFGEEASAAPTEAAIAATILGKAADIAAESPGRLPRSPGEVVPAAEIEEPALSPAAAARPARFQAEPLVRGAEAPELAEKPRPSRRVPLWAWLVAGVVAAGAVGGAFLAFGSPISPPASSEITPPRPTAALEATSPASAALEPEPTSPAGAPLEPESTRPARFICQDAIGCVDIAPDQPVHLAYMLTLSGFTAYLGEDLLGGIEIAIDDRGGQVLGHAILLTGEDSGCNPDAGLAAASNIAADPTIVGIIGTACSSAMLAAMSTVSDAGLTILSPSNTLPALTLEGGAWRPGYYRTAHTDLYLGTMAAEFARQELEARTAVAIHDPSLYSAQLSGIFVRRFEELGGTILRELTVAQGDMDMTPALRQAGVGSPDVLYIPLFEPEGPLIIQQMDEFDSLKGTVLMGADGLLVDTFPENAGPNAVGMYLTGPLVQGAAYQEFLARWEAKYGGAPPSGFHAFAYDAANILLEAIERVGVRDPDGTLHVGRQNLREAISSVSSHDGLTGMLDCGEKEFAGVGISKGDCATGQALGVFRITAAEVFNGKWPPDVVWTPGD